MVKKSSDPDMPVQQDYFTVQQLSEYSQIGVKTLYAAVQNREITHVKVGAKTVIKKADFESWFDSKAKKAVSPNNFIAPSTSKKVFSWPRK